jgi:hypothetical protein
LDSFSLRPARVGQAAANLCVASHKISSAQSAVRETMLFYCGNKEEINKPELESIHNISVIVTLENKLDI